MYKWISAIGLQSDVILDNLMIDCQLLNDFKQLKYFPMSSDSSSMIENSLYDQQWIPNISDLQDNDAHNESDQLDSLDICTQMSSMINNQWMSNTSFYDNELDSCKTHHELNQSQNNFYQPINLCFNLIDSEDLDEERYISIMNEINFGTEHDKELLDRIIKQKKTSSFGFSSLQRRIEKVKHDLFNLTNKLNTNYPDENSSVAHCFYNLGIENLTEDNEVHTLNNSEDNEDKVDADKLWKSSSQLNSKNPFSELSESTQKILNRLNLKDDDGEEIDFKEVVDIDEDIEMEEDELEFTFSNRQDSFLNSFMTKGGTLPVIEEQDEEDSSSDEETESAKSTVIERCIVTTDNGSGTSKSISMHSFDITDSEAYITPLSSFRICENKQEFSDDTEEYFSDFAKCSVSSYSSRESLKSQDVEKVELSCAEVTLRAEQEHMEQLSENGVSVHDKSSSSMKGEEDFASEAEYDNSGWSTEDIPQSAEQSDSLYDKPYRSILKSSLPDLLESSDSHDIDLLGGSLITRHYNKSTDLDEVIDQITPYLPPSVGRLSQSLCNLFTAKSQNKIRPDDFFQDRASFDNLLETDLDSGYVSIYKPVKETEILTKVDFSCSMGNVNNVEGNSHKYQAPLIDKLRRKAGSVTELRIADSLTKLNIPKWLNLRDDEECERLYDADSHIYSLPIQRYPTSLDRTLEYSLKRTRPLSREGTENCCAPIIKPKSTTSIILPSQLIKQSSQRKLNPIQFCQARRLLLPNKMIFNDIK